MHTLESKDVRKSELLTDTCMVGMARENWKRMFELETKLEGVYAPTIWKTVQHPVGDTSAVVVNDEERENRNNFGFHLVEVRKSSEAATDFDPIDRCAMEAPKEAVAPMQINREIWKIERRASQNVDF